VHVRWLDDWEVHMDSLLRIQWDATVAWLGSIDLHSSRELPTSLGTWTVVDLVAHLGLGLELVHDIEADTEEATPLSVGEYVSAYPAAAAEIAGMTQTVKHRIGPELVPGLIQIGESAWARLESLDVTRVRARRGPMLKEDYVLTRLIEVVVHTDDLFRVIPDVSDPVLSEAADEVAACLAQIYQGRAGRTPDSVDPREWIRLACGRVPSADPNLPLL
jgi:hypothetical protein